MLLASTSRPPNHSTMLMLANIAKVIVGVNAARIRLRSSATANESAIASL